MEMMQIEAELRAPATTAQIARFQIAADDYVFYDETAYWLDLSLTPRKNLSGRHLNGGQPGRFRPVGGLMAIPAGHKYEFRTEGGSMASVLCLLSRDLFRTWFEDELEWTDERLAAGLNVTSSNIRDRMLHLARELRSPGLASGAMTELIAGQIAIELGRYCAAIKDVPKAGGLAAWRLRLIEEKLTEPGPAPTLPELAQLCSLSVRQLTRGFRTSRGRTLGDYMAEARTDVAKRLLARDEAIKTIAGVMGFRTASAFSCAFRRSTGMTPRDFRQSVAPKSGLRRAPVRRTAQSSLCLRGEHLATSRQ